MADDSAIWVVPVRHELLAQLLWLLVLSAVGLYLSAGRGLTLVIFAVCALFFAGRQYRQSVIALREWQPEAGAVMPRNARVEPPERTLMRSFVGLYGIVFLCLAGLVYPAFGAVAGGEAVGLALNVVFLASRYRRVERGLGGTLVGEIPRYWLSLRRGAPLPFFVMSNPR